MEKAGPRSERLGRPGSVYQARSCAGSEDLQRLLALIQTSRPPEWRADYPGRGDLFEMMQSPAVQAGTRLWLEGGTLVTYAIVDESNNLLFDAAPDVLEVLGDEIVRWGMECGARRGSLTLDAVCRAGDTARVGFLERQGFRMTGEQTLLMQRELREPIPEVELPAGFTIRAATGEAEAPALAALHRAAFGTEYMTTEKRLAMMRAPGYDGSLDLVAVAPRGALAAYCMCSLEAGEEGRSDARQGWTDPVATHPSYRRLGLARALLSTGLRLLWERGMDFANLGTSGENTAMQRAAESVGFIVKDRKLWFEKPIQSRSAPTAGLDDQ